MQDLSDQCYLEDRGSTMQGLSGQCYLEDRGASTQGLSGQCYLEDRGAWMQGLTGQGARATQTARLTWDPLGSCGADWSQRTACARRLRREDRERASFI